MKFTMDELSFLRDCVALLCNVQAFSPDGRKLAEAMMERFNKEGITPEKLAKNDKNITLN